MNAVCIELFLASNICPFPDDIKMARICVLGAGVAGLSSAVNIQSILPEVDVAIIADQFNTETTSDGAAGNFGILLGRTNADICRLR